MDVQPEIRLYRVAFEKFHGGWRMGQLRIRD
jgi:hypothetical protein